MTVCNSRVVSCRCRNAFASVLVLASVFTIISAIPQQIFIPELGVFNTKVDSQNNNNSPTTGVTTNSVATKRAHQQKKSLLSAESSTNEEKEEEESNSLSPSGFPFNLNHMQLNELFNYLNSNKDVTNMDERFIAYMDQALSAQSPVDLANVSVPSSPHSTEQTTLQTTTTTTTASPTTSPLRKRIPFSQAKVKSLSQRNSYTTTKTTTTTTTTMTTAIHRLHPSNEDQRSECSDSAAASASKLADAFYCNLYHACELVTDAVGATRRVRACPEGFMFSTSTRRCDRTSEVECGERVPFEFDHVMSMAKSMPQMSDYMNDYYNQSPSPSIVNGSLECMLGTDGYFQDPEFCNIYHHCLAGVDYAENCPHQLVWNDRKKMCDWQTNVNCTDRIIPVAQGKHSFCTDKADNKYPDAVYCNVFHHCLGGIDNVVRCDEELQWNEQDKKCDWENKVKCKGKMLPSEKHYNSTFCIGKADGPYAHQEYCNVYHVCESGTDNIRQCPNQLFWDNKSKRCDWSGNVECTGRTLITLSTDTTLFCMERHDGLYADADFCNVYHNCLSGIDFKTKCPVGLVWNDTKQDCDWSDSTECAVGSVLRDNNDIDAETTFCSDKPNGKYAHDAHCNRYYVCQNGKDIVFTCQNNLRYNATKQECDWAVSVDCNGKADFMWEGVKENFCKNRPDGNYPDALYCNIFHQCQAAVDYPKRCSNRLMFNEEKGECDWEDQVDCEGKDKLIETIGLLDESKPVRSGDGKGRVTKFCMTKENGNYADLYYCNVYHNCHGGFDTVQYCSNGLVWRQDNGISGTCDWPLNSNIENGVNCGTKKIFMIEKQSHIDIMATLRSDFCISRGEGLFSHTKYCDLYIHCTAQAVAITMECSPGLIFNEDKSECDYFSEDQIDSSKNSSYCPLPKQILRPKPKAADGTLMFNGNDVTGQFPTKFNCEQKTSQSMHNDDDWCNIYHVCAGPRDNIFICPPGTVFNTLKQGCFDRYTTQVCSGSINYYKPSMKAISHTSIQQSNENSDDEDLLYR